MTNNTDTQAAADLAAAEAETVITEPVADALPEVPVHGLRAQAVELVGQVKHLSEQLEAQRIELAALRATHPVSAQIEAAPSAGTPTVETLASVAKTTPATTPIAIPAATTPVARADSAAPAVAPPKATPAATPAVVETPAAETVALTFDSLIDSMDEPQREVIERHIVGLRTALDKEREERKGAQKAVRNAQAEIEQLPTLRQQLEQAAQAALDTRAQALFFEHAGSNDVKRGSARLAFLAAKDGQCFNDDGSVQWDSLQARFPDLFEGSARHAPTGAPSGAPVQKEAVVTERPVVAPRTSASAGAGAGAPPRRPFSMTSAIRSAAGRQVK